MHNYYIHAQPHPRFFLPSTGMVAAGSVVLEPAAGRGCGTRGLRGEEPAPMLKEPSPRSAFPEAPSDALNGPLFHGFRLLRAGPKLVCNHLKSIIFKIHNKTYVQCVVCNSAFLL
jgi:hypothetical protein